MRIDRRIGCVQFLTTITPKTSHFIETEEMKSKESGMKTHNASIYHCHSRGRIEHAGPEADPPQCWGYPMTKACENTVGAGNIAGERTQGGYETASPVIEGRKKPQ